MSKIGQFLPLPCSRARSYDIFLALRPCIVYYIDTLFMWIRNSALLGTLTVFEYSSMRLNKVRGSACQRSAAQRYLNIIHPVHARIHLSNV